MRNESIILVWGFFENLKLSICLILKCSEHQTSWTVLFPKYLPFFLLFYNLLDFGLDFFGCLKSRWESTRDVLLCSFLFALVTLCIYMAYMWSTLRLCVHGWGDQTQLPNCLFVGIWNLAISRRRADRIKQRAMYSGSWEKLFDLRA